LRRAALLNPNPLGQDRGGEPCGEREQRGVPAGGASGSNGACTMSARRRFGARMAAVGTVESGQAVGRDRIAVLKAPPCRGDTARIWSTCGCVRSTRIIESEDSSGSCRGALHVAFGHGRRYRARRRRGEQQRSQRDQAQRPD